mmetsp:Transcript_74661/g.230660  ORF Transcript_74661/g.230660 Transcript_74661/m.230660 type:complete len:297 (+) Transcript_74661:235-1125(+)
MEIDGSAGSASWDGLIMPPLEPLYTAAAAAAAATTAVTAQSAPPPLSSLSLLSELFSLSLLAESAASSAASSASACSLTPASGGGLVCFDRSSPCRSCLHALSSAASAAVSMPNCLDSSSSSTRAAFAAALLRTQTPRARPSVRGKTAARLSLSKRPLTSPSSLDTSSSTLFARSAAPDSAASHAAAKLLLALRSFCTAACAASLLRTVDAISASRLDFHVSSSCTHACPDSRTALRLASATASRASRTSRCTASTSALAARMSARSPSAALAPALARPASADRASCSASGRKPSL